MTRRRGRCDFGSLDHEAKIVMSSLVEAPHPSPLFIVTDGFGLRTKLCHHKVCRRDNSLHQINKSVTNTTWVAQWDC